jgi:hypothetical protein
MTLRSARHCPKAWAWRPIDARALSGDARGFEWQADAPGLEPDRCPRCGAQLALVGRLHLCRKDARLEGAVDRRGLGLGKALERPKPRLVEPANRPVNRAVNGPVIAAVNKAEKRKAYMREKMRARRAAARAVREDKAGQG